MPKFIVVGKCRYTSFFTAPEAYVARNGYLTESRAEARVFASEEVAIEECNERKGSHLSGAYVFVVEEA